MEYILPLLLFIGLALFAGIVLTFMARKFPGEATDSENAVRNELPGLNCGTCGYAGCNEYAHSIVASGAPTNACVPGGEKSARAISAIMGVDYAPSVGQKAFVRCNGNYSATSDKYDYRGVLSCAASAKFYGGRSSCRYGCLGFGDCEAACPNGAIHVENGCARVDTSLCTGCMICASKCPKGIIVPIKDNAFVIPACSSQAMGKEVIKTCKNGCIACHRCEKSCPTGAIKLEGNKPVIDYSLCTACGQCVSLCPVKCIKDLRS